MDVEMEDIEFDFKEVVNDISMSDDELEKELKEFEKENEVKSRDEGSPQKNVINMSETVDCKKKGNHKRQHSKDTSSLETLYDDLESSSKDNHEDTGNKKHFDRCNMHKERTIDYKRLNKSLYISRNCDPMVVGREIAYRLHEPKTRLFGHVVCVLGQNMVSEIFAETKDLVNNGGIKTDSGDRVRSPGGTFLYIMKNRCYATSEQVKEIFKEENKSKKEHRKRMKRQNTESEKSKEKKEVDGLCKSLVSNAKEECSEDSIKDVSATTVVKHEKGSPKDVKMNSGMKHNKDEGCELSNHLLKGTTTTELRNDIPVVKEVVGDKDDDENNRNNISVKTEELEEGEIDCNDDEVSTEGAT